MLGGWGEESEKQHKHPGGEPVVFQMLLDYSSHHSGPFFMLDRTDHNSQPTTSGGPYIQVAIVTLLVTQGFLFIYLHTHTHPKKV